MSADVSTAPPGAGAGTIDSALALRAVHKTWGDRLVLAGIDLALVPGRAAVVRGANGAGKTTLLRVAAGLVAADSGSVSVCGCDPTRRRRAAMRALGFVPVGDRGLYPRLSARQHLRLVADLALLGSSTRAALDGALAEVGLADVADRPAQRLSTGQRQRLKIALAVVHAPRLVLLDEPTSGLDPDGVGMLRGVLDRLVERGGATVLCVPDADGLDLPYGDSLRLAAGDLRPA
jgi:ABC-2 type transport system ATP-binding protein